MTQEIEIRKKLQDALKVPVLFEVPDGEIPAQFVVLQRIGQSEEDHVTRLSIAAQSISTESLLRAAILDDLVQEEIRNLVDLRSISSVRIVNSYNFTDTSTDRYRYQSIFDIFFIKHA